MFLSTFHPSAQSFSECWHWFSLSISLSLKILLIIIILNMGVFLPVCLFNTRSWVPVEDKNNPLNPWDWSYSGHELLCGCRVLSCSPPKEQPELPTAGPSLQPSCASLYGLAHPHEYVHTHVHRETLCDVCSVSVISRAQCASLNVSTFSWRASFWCTVFFILALFSS